MIAAEKKQKMLKMQNGTKSTSKAASKDANKTNETDESRRDVYRFTRSNLNETNEKVYQFIVNYFRTNGYAPSVRDVCRGVGLKSTSTAHSHLNRLAKNGRILYQSGKRRAIALLPESEGESRYSVAEISDDTSIEMFAQHLDAFHFVKPTLSPSSPSESDVHAAPPRFLPLVGTVTAGKPILATEQVECMLPLPGDFFVDSDELFVLKVRGDSMIEAAILDGDLAIVRKQNVADYGTIVVALIDDEATVKRFINKNNRPMLKPENSAYDLIPFDRASCRILGQVVQILRPHVL